MRVHSGVLPYPCHFPGCSKRFRWKSSLKPHIRVHLASGHLPPPTSSSDTNTPIPSAQSADKHANINFNQNTTQQPQLTQAHILTEKSLNPPPNLPPFSSVQSGDQSPTSVNAPVPEMSHNRDTRKDIQCRIDSALLYPPTKPPVVRVLFQDSHVHQQFDEGGEIDLSTDSVLSSSVTSNETDGFTFTLDSPIERSDDSTDKTLTDHLWKSDIQVMDPFEDLPIDDTESNFELLSSLEGTTGISANSTEQHVSDPQWIFSSGESTVSSADFTTTLNSYPCNLTDN